jgi:hypothetical protein
MLLFFARKGTMQHCYNSAVAYSTFAVKIKNRNDGKHITHYSFGNQLVVHRREMDWRGAGQSES